MSTPVINPGASKTSINEFPYPSDHIPEHAKNEAIFVKSENSNYGFDKGFVSQSPFAYVTLIHGIDTNLKYRGFLFNTLVAKKALAELGSTADFIALIGYSNDDDITPFEDDMNLLRKNGIIVYRLPRLLGADVKVGFAEMALLKVTPWSFTQYSRVQFLDGDVLPLLNMDCYFQLKQTTFNTGSASPLNSGWFVGIPNIDIYNILHKKAVERLSSKWDEVLGWGMEIPTDGSLKYRTRRRSVQQWHFNGASLDQGLLTWYFILNNGQVTMLDIEEVTSYNPAYHVAGPPIPLKLFLSNCCHIPNGNTAKRVPAPINSFAHFTGKSKPWMQDIVKHRDKNIRKWGMLLDELNIPGVNSSNINHGNRFAPPLGFFAPNK